MYASEGSAEMRTTEHDLQKWLGMHYELVAFVVFGLLYYRGKAKATEVVVS